MVIQALAALGKGQELGPFQYEPEKLGPFDVDIRISHCGICHSDVHLIDNDWGISRYPLVPGHEIIGTVSETGSLVTHLNQGDRVGVGWQRSSCMICEFCMSGQHNLCERQEATCAGHFGGFADRIRVDSRFAIRIPEGLASENAAPLLCGGITVFSPLLRFGVSPVHRVGVIGIGGLGHLALQFARAFGCEVTAFSHSPDKEAEAKKFGAHRFVSTKDKKAMAALDGTLDFILNTANADLAWNDFLDCLRPNGKLCFVGVPPSPAEVSVGRLLGGRKSVAASPIGSPDEIRIMLEFAVRHGIEAKTEVCAMSEANAALAKVRDNSARYRMVLRA
jgi:alcohol/geraniol dehydrogenase (NADP+)